MSNTVTLAQEELTQLRENQETLNTIALALGQTELQIYALTNSAQALKEKYDSTVQEQENLSKALSEKYGDGSVNLESGEFTSAS